MSWSLEGYVFSKKWRRPWDKNMQATNQSLILSAAWRIVEDSNSHLSKILKSKYYPHTSFWKASQSVPKSAFCTSILKVRHMLIANSFYQLTEGNISLWSNPWYSSWDNIYDHVIRTFFTLYLASIWQPSNHDAPGRSFPRVPFPLCIDHPCFQNLI